MKKNNITIYYNILSLLTHHYNFTKNNTNISFFNKKQKKERSFYRCSF